MSKKINSEDIFNFGKNQGLTPEYMLMQRGDPLLAEAERKVAENASYESIWGRLKEMLPSLIVTVETSEHIPMVGLWQDCLDRNLSSESLIFLHQQGMNLKWLFFGIGLMKKCEPILPSIIKTDAKRITAIAELKTLLGYSTGDLNWLFGREYTSPDKDTLLSSSVSILIRILEHIPPIQFFPQMPDVVTFLDRIKDTLQAIHVDSLADGDPEVKEALRILQKSATKFSSLFFVRRNAISAWRNGVSSPKIQHIRLMYILSVMLDKYGEAGFIAYIKLLNAEAIGHGFSGFTEVLSTGVWKK